MESNNWRVKRDPSELSTRDSDQRSHFQARRGGSRGGGYDQRSGTGRPQLGQSRDGFRKPFNDTQAEKAIEEGRRVYVGNMPYEATTKDVEILFKDLAEGIQTINMSVDPMTGRNPSYCFVDFTSRELAEQVMVEYNGRDFLRRPLRVKPGVKSGTGTGRYDVNLGNKSEENSYAYDRWKRLDKPEEQNDSAIKERRRLYVGGLPKFENQAIANNEIRDLFQGYNLKVISKLIPAHQSKKNEDGNHNYCFVDVSSADEAGLAIVALNGQDKWGGTIKINHSSASSTKLGERRRLFVGGLPEFPNQEATDAGIRVLFDGYEVSTISKLFLPRESSEAREGNHCFCFVELANEEQTDKAIIELDWMEKWDGKVRVKPATSSSKNPRSGGGWGPSREE